MWVGGVLRVLAAKLLIRKSNLGAAEVTAD